LNRSQPASGSPQQPTAGRERVVWIDLFRGAAVLVMIETHVVNTFMATALRAEGWFTVLNYINGLVAPSFLFIAGFVQGMERRPRGLSDTTPGPIATPKPINFARRALRLLGIGALGYALHFPWFELGHGQWDAALRVGSQVDVLQCIAASLGALLFVTWLVQRLRLGDRLWWMATAILLVFTVLVAPTAAICTNLPVPLLAWTNSSTGSWFPLFPWAGFVFAGALAGAASRLRQVDAEAATATTPVAPLAMPNPLAFRSARPMALLVAPLPLAVAAWACRDAQYSSVAPASFLERTAWVFVLAATCEWIAAHRRLPAVVLFAGKRSLTLYVVHLVLISALVGLGVPAQKFPLFAVVAMVGAVAAISLHLTRLVPAKKGLSRMSKVP